MVPSRSCAMGKLAETNQEGIFLHDKTKSVATYQEESHPQQLEIDWKQVGIQA